MPRLEEMPPDGLSRASSPDAGTAKGADMRRLTIWSTLFLYAVAVCTPAVILNENAPDENNRVSFGIECLLNGFVFGLMHYPLGILWSANPLLLAGVSSVAVRARWFPVAFGALALASGLTATWIRRDLLFGGYCWFASLVVFLLGATVLASRGQWRAGCWYSRF
jgi:hypothetical protein